MIRRAPPSTTTNQDSWSKSMEYLKEAMNEARISMQMEKNTGHNRGHYEYVSTGISYGGGQKVSKII